MAGKVKLGIIGSSEGNGHPYSWSAIFNGYDPQKMKECEFPTIPEYLQQQTFPDDFLGQFASVTHIWTQNIHISERVANASLIPNIVDRPEDMIAHVDAILLARDDGENHFKMAKPFLQAGLPIFIDKPFTLSVQQAQQLWDAQKYSNQLFTCSSLRFAKELLLTENDYAAIGRLRFIEGSVMKKWETYAVHLIEPIVAQCRMRGKLQSVKAAKKGDCSFALIEWEELIAILRVTGEVKSPLQLIFYGENGTLMKTFTDSFSCFRESLKYFIDLINGSVPNINRSETEEIVQILELGLI